MKYNTTVFDQHVLPSESRNFLWLLLECTSMFARSGGASNSC